MNNTVRNKSLKNFNTCGIDVNCDYFIQLNNSNDIETFVESYKKITQPIYILGHGANTLFKEDFKGTIIHINTKKIEIISSLGNDVFVRVKAGVIWDDFINYCIEHQLYGAENLVSIPSTVGAVPIQNIGAYGVEAKDIIHKVIYYNLETSTKHEINNTECKFSYRNSIFKKELKDKILITEVVFKLSKKAALNLSYGDIYKMLEIEKITNPNINDITRIIRSIRQNKLPDYNVNGNAGSFFKNPIIDIEKFNKLKLKFPEIISYPIDDNKIKIAAAWLIDNAGLKSFQIGGAAVHKKQALVLVNVKNASGKDFYKLSKFVQARIHDIYDIKLNPEVIII